MEQVGIKIAPMRSAGDTGGNLNGYNMDLISSLAFSTLFEGPGAQEADAFTSSHQVEKTGSATR